jgi:hypothetical protein
MDYLGKVVIKRFAKGMKSEREAVMLVTNHGEYVLRRVGGNPEYDPILRGLDGKTLHLNGTVYDYTLLVSDWHEPELPAESGSAYE